MVERHANEVNHRRPAARNGRYVSIGVIDSLLDFPSGAPYTVDEQRNFVASDERDTTNHGTRVAFILSRFAPKAVYSFYRTIAPDGEFTPSNYLKALDAARSNSVDIVNSSAGIHHEDCRGQCRVCHAVRQTLADGVCVVAGAGNAMDADTGVYCPAREPDVVSVGVYESVCTNEISPPIAAPVGFSPDLLPTGSYRAPPVSEVDADWTPNKTYCGGQQCTPTDSCREHRVEHLWAGNPEQGIGGIDVYAPGTTLVGMESGPPRMDIGCSFSAPIVTGVLADAFSELHGSRPIPSPAAIDRALSRLSGTVGNTQGRKLDAAELFDHLSRR